MHSMTVALLLACCLAAALAAPAPHHSEDHDNQRHGSVSVSGSRTKGVGTAVHVNGHGDIWRSRDGNARVRAEGRYDQVVHGPAKGSRDYGAAVTYELKI